VERNGIGDESGHPHDWQNHPMAAKAVEENVADDDCGHCTGIEPEDRIISQEPKSLISWRVADTGCSSRR
jgi:hypothetical protein